MSYLKNNRDANEAELVQLWQEFGAVWIPQDRHKGFDGVLVYRGVHIVEIKNPDKKWKLTKAEQARKAEIEAIGEKYHIITNSDEALRLLGF